ncbi:hypothetical protein AO385_2067 [Moraxella catarrhalis]|uniref:Uncharacterized protein n=1 Tax=Moraxella catarrhalis TaxID=480 RepID=A0A198UG25_MORCA|nr:hypothetical protein AO385_2067 [Moraxella catarrhalis]OAU95371.1 hypothetical protein AO384_1562 [Moraxella catarrhalis]OAU98247.1 hypothetical protein AO383_0703 [Moraxella catarrhalis]OAV01903.1 hypothetical protein AO382_0269 [Moraxella catarrhalis]
MSVTILERLTYWSKFYKFYELKGQIPIFGCRAWVFGDHLGDQAMI